MRVLNRHIKIFIFLDKFSKLTTFTYYLSESGLLRDEAFVQGAVQPF
jgi:hypothetical protein